MQELVDNYAAMWRAAAAGGGAFPRDRLLQALVEESLTVWKISKLPDHQLKVLNVRRGLGVWRA